LRFERATLKADLRIVFALQGLHDDKEESVMTSATLQHYGIKEFHALGPDAERDKALEELQIRGCAVLENVLSDAELAVYRDKLDAVYAKQVTEIGSESLLSQMNDAHIVRAPLGYDEAFLALATQKRVLELATALLGDYFILQLQNGIINLPNLKNYQISWHRDLNYQHYVSSRPLAMSALFCIDDFKVETGATYVLPATHKVEVFPSPEYVAKYEEPVLAKAGSVIIFDSMVYHRAGENSSQQIRRGINHMYSIPLIKQQISFPRMLAGRYQDDPFLNKFLGYDSESGDSPAEWRQRKLRKAGLI
jgi:ectoine hydroxylase-related dioxygenase (phytanoyl-CoA dioxygenase family)